MELTGPAPTETSFTGVRIRFDSAKSFDDVVAALLADVGHRPVPINDIGAQQQSWHDYQDAIESRLGPSGFMLFALLEHGAWISKAGINRKVLRVVIGNPLIAVTMIRHDVTAGLFAPVELLITDQGDSGSALIYLRPSSLMVIEPNPALTEAAEMLDDKLAALAAKVTAG